MSLDEKLGVFGDIVPSDGTDTKCLLVMLIDRSYSIGVSMIDIVKGIHLFKDDILKDPIARRRLEVAVITYGNDLADLVIPPTGVSALDLPSVPTNVDDLPSPWIPSGNTPMARGLRLAVQTVDKWKLLQKQSGYSYFRPWIVNLTDGQPTDPIDEWQATKENIRGCVQNKLFHLFNLGTDTADFGTLMALSNRTAQLKGARFAEFFQWLSNSMGAVTGSIEGNKIDFGSIDGFAMNVST